MEVFITGGTGLVGHYLIAALQARGDVVRALVLPSEETSWLMERNVAIYHGDVRRPETLVVPMHGVGVVFHLAGLMGVWRPMQDYYDVNVAGVENVCRAALLAGAQRLIHVSSWTVYGMGVGRPVYEDFPLAPLREPYALTKAEGDQVVQRMIVQDNLPAVIIRPGTIFGPGDHLNFGRMADRLRAGKGVIVGSGRNTLPCVYVTDVVQGLLLAADHPSATGHAYNISNDQPLTQEEFLRAIAEDIGLKPPAIHVPYRVLYPAAVVAEHVAKLLRLQEPLVTRHGVNLFGTDNRHAIDKVRAELGYEPHVSLREGIRLTAAWYREHKWQSSVTAGRPTAHA